MDEAIKGKRRAIWREVIIYGGKASNHYVVSRNPDRRGSVTCRRVLMQIAVAACRCESIYELRLLYERQMETPP